MSPGPRSATSRPRPSPQSASSISRRRLSRTWTTTATRRNARRCRTIWRSRCRTSAARSRPTAFPFSRSQGFEADDVIGTLGRKAAEQGIPGLRRLQRQGHAAAGERQSLRAESAERQSDLRSPPRWKRFSACRPEQVIDVMALRGDSIDNIPGAPGIGDKGSVELIKRFGSLETRWTTPQRSRTQDLSRIAAEQ